MRLDGDPPHATLGPQVTPPHDSEVAIPQRLLVKDGQLVATYNELLPAELGEIQPICKTNTTASFYLLTTI